MRVRQAIAYLNYDDLLRTGKIPSMMDNVVSSNKKYPPWVYTAAKKNPETFSIFGMAMDFIIRKMLQTSLSEFNVDIGHETLIQLIESDPKYYGYAEPLIRYRDPTTKWVDTVYDSYLLVCDKDKLFTKENWFSYIPTLQNLNKDLCSKWKTYKEFLGSSIKFNQEIQYPLRGSPGRQYEGIVGHPDISTDNAVLDIKCNTDFSKTAKESFLQVLSYVAIMRSSNNNVRYLGIVLPMQRELKLYDLAHWNSKPFLEVLAKICNRHDQIIISEDIIESIGSHVGRTKHIGDKKTTTKTIGMTEAIQGYVQNRGVKPIQMFLRSNRSGKASGIKEADLVSAGELIKGLGLKYYTHAIYLINMCTPNAGEYEKDIKWYRELLQFDLKTTHNLGGRGVVVHTGTRNIRNKLTLTDEEALNNMETFVRSVLPDASEQCPLLLETPVGEGLEICWQLEELVKFYNRFTLEEKKRVKICLDTCHVYVAGYDPLDYLERWTKYCSVDSIALIHFNDSEKPMGSHVDRHSFYLSNQGHIGLARLMEVASWCYQRGISMVNE